MKTDSEKSNPSVAPELFYLINAKFRITEIHHFFPLINTRGGKQSPLT